MKLKEKRRLAAGPNEAFVRAETRGEEGKRSRLLPALLPRSGKKRVRDRGRAARGDRRSFARPPSAPTEARPTQDLREAKLSESQQAHSLSHPSTSRETERVCGRILRKERQDGGVARLVASFPLTARTLLTSSGTYFFPWWLLFLLLHSAKEKK